MSIDKLSSLIGEWKGKGTAKFPTINTTEYIEEITFRRIENTPVIFFEQRTWYSVNNEKGDALHSESGYVNIKDGNYEVSNSQGNGRVEVLSGKIIETDDNSFHFSLKSKLFGNDDRLIRTTRDYYVNGNSMRYELRMATQNTPEFHGHLEASLNKV